MAVYKRTYRGYEGDHTPEWSRFLVITRQASANLFRSRFMIGFGALCLFPFLVTAVLILAGLAVTLGLILLIIAVLQWRSRGYGTLDYAETMRVVIPGVTLTALGVQGMFSSFLISLFGMRRR